MRHIVASQNLLQAGPSLQPTFTDYRSPTLCQVLHKAAVLMFGGLQIEGNMVAIAIRQYVVFVTHDQEEALTLSDTVAILDGGRIVQEGRPQQIYERPATRFAAAFLGDANFFKGRVAGGGVEVADSLIRTGDPLPAAGTEAMLAVRPEKIRLHPAGIAGAGDNSLTGVVRQVIYAGAVSTYFVDRPDGTALKVLAQNRENTAVSPGDSVLLAWSAAHTVVIHE